MKIHSLTLYLVPKLFLIPRLCVRMLRHRLASVRGSFQPRALARDCIWSLEKRKTRKMGLAFIVICFCFFANAAFAQSDSDKKKTITSKQKRSELVFEDILIEAIIEKPNIAILPTRRLKKLGEIDFINRSFTTELRAVPEKSFLFDGEFEKPKKIDNIKKVLKKRKK